MNSNLKCKIINCKKLRPYRNTIHPYCEMHKVRFKRHGHFGLRDKSFHKLERLPHAVDSFIREHAVRMLDQQIAEQLYQQGFKGATVWTVKYRRRKLGIRKYASGDIKKHKAWIRRQALQKHGNNCELCGYHLYVETHHILPKHKGGLHAVENLMVVCSNCHTLFTRGYLQLSDRSGIHYLRQQVKQILRKAYPNLG